MCMYRDTHGTDRQIAVRYRYRYSCTILRTPLQQSLCAALPNIVIYPNNENLEPKLLCPNTNSWVVRPKRIDGLEPVGALLPGGITLTATDMIADKDGVALIMDGDAEGINGEYDNKYVFVYKFKEGLIHKVTEYNSDLLVATRLYKQKLMPIELTEEIGKKN